MAEKDVRRPTDTELGILNVLWERGGCTASDVHEALSEEMRGGTMALYDIDRDRAELSSQCLHAHFNTAISTAAGRSVDCM